MKRNLQKILLFGAALFSWWIYPAHGFMSLTIPTADRGAIYSDGTSDYPSDQRFSIGWNGFLEGRSFFIYSLPALDSQTVLAEAEVQLRLNVMWSQDLFETLEFHSISGSLTNTSGCYQDIADGALYGSAAISGPDWTSVPLTSDALDEMMTIMYSGGGLFALGGALSSLQYLPYRSEEIMGWIPAGAGTAGTSGSDLLLTFSAIPEPSVAGLMFMGVLIVIGFRTYTYWRMKYE